MFEPEPFWIKGYFDWFCCWFLIDQFHRGHCARRERGVLGLFNMQYAPARQVTQRCNSFTCNPTQCSGWFNSTQWQVDSLLAVTEETRLAPQNCQPFSPLRRSSHGRPHTTRRKVKVTKGNSKPNFLLEYLQEFMWRRWYGDTHPNGCFKRLLQDIAEQNPL